MKELSRNTIMVVDDSNTIVLMIKAILEEAGYNVIKAFSGEEGIDLALLNKPDVILLDVMMPGIDGFETCRKLKDHPETCDIPVIIVTAVNEIVSKVKGLNSGASDYLTKPFSAPELLARVASQLRIKILHDELKARNEELLKTYTELKEAQSQLVQMAKLSALGEMIAGIAHELNNPLSGIIGYGELLLSNSEIAKFHPQIKKIHKQADRCRKIVQNLLSFSRGQMPEKIMCSLNDIVQEVLELIKYNLLSDGIQSCKMLDEGLGNILLDRNQIQQVLFNIINNAHQAMKGIEGEKKLFIKTSTGASSIKVEISDTGIGIPAENLYKIFDPFFTTREVGEGRGLGLSICYGIIKEHGGSIRVESTVGQGSVFTIEFPFVTQQEERDNSLIKKRSVLVIDDEEVIRDVVSSALENLGYTVEIIDDGYLALDEIKVREYDLILTDIKMPGLDGKALFESIKERNPSLSDKIVFMTGDTIGLPRDNFLIDFKDRIIEKPFSISQIQDKVKSFFCQR